MIAFRTFYFFIIFLIGLSSCKNSNNIQAYLSHQDIEKRILEDTTKCLTVFKGLKLRATSLDNQDIIEADSNAYPLASTQFYLHRRIKGFETDRRAIYNILGYGYELRYFGLSELDELYSYKVDNILKTIQDDPPTLSLLIDSYLSNSYRCNLIINYKKNDQIMYEKLDGWFSYESFKDTVYSITSIFNKNASIHDDCSYITDGIKNLLIEKYGFPNISESYFMKGSRLAKFNLDTTGISISLDIPTITQRPHLNIVDSYFWNVGSYEIQLYVNKVEHKGKITYEYIIRYIDIKSLASYVDYVDSLKASYQEKIQRQNADEQESYKRQQSNQNI